MSENNTFELALKIASTLPMVRIDRGTFLYKELIKYYPKDQVEVAIKNNPAYAGIPVSVINKIAKNCINYETNKVSSISFVAGLPGGFAMVGTIPADVAQYFGHVLRILQKLVYLYGCEELIGEDCSFDDETVSKAIPVIGGVASGGLTYITYKPMANKLKSHLESLKWCDTSYYSNLEGSQIQS